MLPEYHRIVLLTEGCLGPFTSKTAASLLRYRAGDVVAVLDSAFAGREVREVIPWAGEVPVFGDFREARNLRPDALFIGIAPVGGALPGAMRRHIADALRAGVDVVSGLHRILGDDAEFAEIVGGIDTERQKAVADPQNTADTAVAHGAETLTPARSPGGRGENAAGDSRRPRILDLRRPPEEQLIASGKARGTRCRRVLTVGTDCNSGKMVTALELTATARRRGLDARFVATGQTGMMISGRGVAIDAVVSDFAAGAVERLVLEAGDCDVCFIEGQGSIAHPGYSGVTLSLLHGCCPDAMVMVHHVGRTHYNADRREPLPDFRALCELYERAAGMLKPARIAGVALNTLGATGAQVEAEARRIREALGVVAVDPVKDGCEMLLDALGCDPHT